MYVIYDHPWMVKPPEQPGDRHRRELSSRAKRSWRRRNRAESNG